MKEIQAENTRYIYVTREEGLPPVSFGEYEVKKIPLDALWTQMLTSMNDFRIVLVSFRSTSNAVWVYYLHWHDPTDLKILDERVQQGTYADEDFTDSIKTEVGTTKCFACNWSGLTLFRSPGDPYIGAPGLEMEKLHRRFDKNGFKRCPNCDSKFTQGVVKIFPVTSGE